jgi:hypothetical protein
VAWIRRTIEALKRADARFANTTKIPMIDGTSAAIKEVVRVHAQAALEKNLVGSILSAIDYRITHPFQKIGGTLDEARRQHRHCKKVFGRRSEKVLHYR